MTDYDTGYVGSCNFVLAIFATGLMTVVVFGAANLSRLILKLRPHHPLIVSSIIKKNNLESYKIMYKKLLYDQNVESIHENHGEAGSRQIYDNCTEPCQRETL